MNLDWSIVWQSRGQLFEGALVTCLLTALTMLIAVPGGIVLALMRGSRAKPIALFATGFVELFRNLPLLLLVYWAFYVMPVLTGLGLSAFRHRPCRTQPERLGLQFRDLPLRASIPSAGASPKPALRLG